MNAKSVRKVAERKAMQIKKKQARKFRKTFNNSLKYINRQIKSASRVGRTSAYINWSRMLDESRYDLRKEVANSDLLFCLDAHLSELGFKIQDITNYSCVVSWENQE